MGSLLTRVQSPKGCLALGHFIPLILATELQILALPNVFVWGDHWPRTTVFFQKNEIQVKYFSWILLSDLRPPLCVFNQQRTITGSKGHRNALNNFLRSRGHWNALNSFLRTFPLSRKPQCRTTFRILSLLFCHLRIQTDAAKHKN